MKIAVICATGKAGNLIAKEALHRGHEVTAIVRNKSKLSLNFFRVIEKDILDITPDDVKDFDAVVDAYGCPPGQEEMHLTVMNSLVKVFEQVPDVRLLIVGGASSLYTDEGMTVQFYENLPPTAKLPINQAKTLDIIKASKVNWTFFNPALQFNFKGMRTASYTLGSDYIIKNNEGDSYISYADYAVAMVDEIENKAFVGKRFTAVAEKSNLMETESDGRKRFKLRLNYELSGQNYHLVMDNGYEYVVNFLNGETLAWAKQGDPFVNQNYKCSKADPKTYMVCFFITEDDIQTCITLVIDLEKSLVTMVKANVGIYPSRSRLTTNQVIFGAIKEPGKPLPTMRHGYTAELVGKKIAWLYSPAVKITHIYMSERYMRSSMKNMPTVDENTTIEQKAEIEDRAKRWGEIFFEEPCYYIKISKHLYLVGMIEDFRNRVNPEAGGGDMLYILNTYLMQDFIRSFSLNPIPDIRIFSAHGEFIDEYDEMESIPSPYHL